jgi:ABC-2 type transport system permease protein
MRAFYKLLIASFKQFFRDRTALFFTFAFPLLFMLIFGLVFSNEDDVSYDIGLVNSGGSSAAAAGISQALSQIPIFSINEGELADKLAELENGDLRAVVVIPADIESSIASGKTADITVYYDPSQSTSVQIILPVLTQTINEINRQLTQQPVLLKLSEQSIQSRHLRAIDYLVPGILAMAILFLALFGGLPLVQWREKQVLKRFSAAPLRRSTLIISQVAYRLVLAVMQTIIIVVIAYFVFNVQVIGSWLMLFAIVFLGTLTFVSLGYLAISRARTTEGAMPIIQLIQFPMLFLSGIFFQVEFLPDFMRPIVTAMPLTYLGDALRQIMVGATPLYPLSTDAAVLAGWLVVCMVLAIRLFRWE